MLETGKERIAEPPGLHHVIRHPARSVTICLARTRRSPEFARAGGYRVGSDINVNGRVEKAVHEAGAQIEG